MKFYVLRQIKPAKAHNSTYIIHQGEEVHDYKGLLHHGLYTIFSTTRYVKTLSDNNY
jgi:hypothetical protein